MTAKIGCLVVTSIFLTGVSLSYAGDSRKTGESMLTGAERFLVMDAGSKAAGPAGELMLTGPNSKTAQKAKISGNQLMLLGQNGKWIVASDGTYITSAGKRIIVVNGAIIKSQTTPPTMQKNAPPKEGTSETDRLRRALDGDKAK